jgi:hypothetical protein
MVVWPEDAISCDDELDSGTYTDPLDPEPNAFRYITSPAQSNPVLVGGGCDGFADTQSE